MTLARNQNYKMKYRPNYAASLGKYKTALPMKGNPPEAYQTSDWGKRCWIIYAHMIAIKKGIVPESQRRGLWFYEA